MNGVCLASAFIVALRPKQALTNLALLALPVFCRRWRRARLQFFAKVQVFGCARRIGGRGVHPSILVCTPLSSSMVVPVSWNPFLPDQMHVCVCLRMATHEFCLSQAFNESTERFNPFFNLSTRDYKNFKAWTTYNPSSSKLPENPTNTNFQPSGRPSSPSGRPASAGPSRGDSRPSSPQKRPTSARTSIPYSPFLPARGEGPIITVLLDSCTNPAASTREQSLSTYKVANTDSPSLQRWLAQPRGIGDQNGRADDLGASARTLARFSRAPPQGPVRSFQRTSSEQRPHLIRHYSATAAAARASKAPPDLMRQIGGLTLGLPVAPEKCRDSNVTSSVAPLLAATWAPPAMKAPANALKLHVQRKQTQVPQLNVSKAVTQKDQEMQAAK